MYFTCKNIPGDILDNHRHSHTVKDCQDFHTVRDNPGGFHLMSYIYRRIFQVKKRFIDPIIKPSECLRSFQTSCKMAKSKFEYVKSFETEDRLDPGHWIVIALKNSNSQQFIKDYNLERPNDKRLIQLMEDCAKCVMEEFKELQLCYTFADEWSFVFSKSTTLYRRRSPKLLTNLCSLTSASFVDLWPRYFKSISLNFVPIVEGTVYLFPSDQGLRDYMTQHQLTCHYRNLYETVLWSLVKISGFSVDEAAGVLKGKSEGAKNEILFSKCNLNYNKEEAVYKKGSTIIRMVVPVQVRTPDGSLTQRNQSQISVLNTDFVKDSFWEEVFPLGQDTKNTGKTHYLKDLEKETKLLPHAWIVVRIDGKGFHKFSEKHNFMKPNDLRSISLMNYAALTVMKEYSNVVLSYGQSDEYTFVIDRYSKMMARNANKIMSCIVSLFAATYVHQWSRFFKDTALLYPPAFDARVILYPNNSCLRDCLSWRQADCHINNMYNLCFWTLIQKGNLSPKEAEKKLSGTFSKDKKQILLSEFNCDYNQEDAIYRKGTVMYRSNQSPDIEVSFSGLEPNISASEIITSHDDIINDKFWNERPWILGTERGAVTVDDLDN
ncbi:uncharacterized protein [Palaemon carinicauda]|uniref:uncharacterized protein isoform X1 n=1 Tax=Palaemon carinicauda TaxID=392227 RepID=UPI0035B59665